MIGRANELTRAIVPRRILPLLKKYDCRIEYYFTDVSAAFFQNRFQRIYLC